MSYSLNYTKILLSALTIAFVAALVFGGTQAFFNDEETSTGNLFTAGALDLLVDSEAHYAGLYCDEVQDGVYQWVDDPIVEEPTTRPELLNQPCDGTWEMTDLGPEHTFFNLSDLKPGDEGENTISLHVENNDAYACVIIDEMQDDDNALTEPEEEAGDTTPGDGEGELSSELRFFAWSDNGGAEAGNNIWEDGEPMLFSNTEGPASDVIDGVVYPLFTPQTGPLAGASTTYVGLYWCYGTIAVDEGTNSLTCDGEGGTNMTQTDSLSADFTFYIEQARNNDEFTCPALVDEEPEPATTTLTLIKEVINDDFGTSTAADFQLTASGTTPFTGFGTTTSVVTPGIYDLSETGPADYTASAWVCDGGQGDADTVTLTEGADITCTITNNDNDPVS